MTVCRLRIVATVCVCLAGQATPARADVETAGANDALAQRYFESIVDDARERRYAIAKQELETLERRLLERTQQLRSRQTELQEWVGKRDAFMARASDSLIAIYANMRPDAAAVRLERLDVQLVAAILLKLAPKRASLILNEMRTRTAAAVTAVIAQAGQAGGNP